MWERKMAFVFAAYFPFPRSPFVGKLLVSRNVFGFPFPLFSFPTFSFQSKGKCGKGR
jgi:hypothetical protein